MSYLPKTRRVLYSARMSKRHFKNATVFITTLASSTVFWPLPADPSQIGGWRALLTAIDQFGPPIASAMLRALAPWVPGAPLPADFAVKHAKETAGSDDPTAFLTKQQYVDAAAAVRAASLAALEKTSDAQLDQPPPPEFAEFTRSVGDLLSLIGTHWTMHLGQWAVIRRKLGRVPLF